MGSFDSEIAFDVMQGSDYRDFWEWGMFTDAGKRYFLAHAATDLALDVSGIPQPIQQLDIDLEIKFAGKYLEGYYTAASPWHADAGGSGIEPVNIGQDRHTTDIFVGEISPEGLDDAEVAAFLEDRISMAILTREDDPTKIWSDVYHAAVSYDPLLDKPKGYVPMLQRIVEATLRANKGDIDRAQEGAVIRLDDCNPHRIQPVPEGAGINDLDRFTLRIWEWQPEQIAMVREWGDTPELLAFAPATESVKD